MTRRSLPASAFVILVALAVVALSGAQRGTDTASHVVIISLDGFGGWALDDPTLHVPTLRQLAAEGASAKRMRPVNPTVTWANHTSMVTGVTPAKHGVIFNGLLLRQPSIPPRVEPWRDKSELVHAKTIYDAVHDRGMTTAQVNWVAIQNAPTITYEFGERPAPTGQVSQELVKGNVISAEDLASFAKRDITWRDGVWTKAAVHILREHRPNLLLVHLLALDTTQHRFGPRTPEARHAMEQLDTEVAAIVDTIDKSDLAPRTTTFVVSDHGFKTVRQRIYPNAAFAKAGLLHQTGGKVPAADVYAVSEGGSAFVYVTKPDPSGALLARARKALAGIEGIAAVVEAADYPKYGLPLPSASDQMGPLMLEAKEGYAFSDGAGGAIISESELGGLGAHGYPNTDPDLAALFIASGRQIKRGTILETIDNIDIAPTAAQLLGVELPNVDGKVERELFGRVVKETRPTTKTKPRTKTELGLSRDTR
jgi:predicted AlkP superfamily pyrophosphatase or phosphodiesterase